MPYSHQEEGAAEGAVLRSMVLLSTLKTAAEVWHAAKERRAGRDPTAQEAPVVVAPWLRTARRELQEMLMRLRAGLVYARHHEEHPTAHLVRHFDALMTIGEVARLLHLIHQRLLSLYPEVGEALLEEVRELEGICGRLAEADEEEMAAALGPFVEQTLVFAVHLRQEVG